MRWRKRVSIVCPHPYTQTFTPNSPASRACPPTAAARSAAPTGRRHSCGQGGAERQPKVWFVPDGVPDVPDVDECDLAR
eukprot:362569-Chlamydomonas_euryale.AAC.4